MVHYDIDSICACRILQTLLRNRHVLYSVAIVRGVGDLTAAYRENCADVRIFIFINCGGTVDLVEILEPEEELIFFILDSHRPTDLCNIYSTSQVRLLGSPEDDSGVPEFRDMFRDVSCVGLSLIFLWTRGVLTMLIKMFYSLKMKKRRKNKKKRTTRRVWSMPVMMKKESDQKPGPQKEDDWTKRQS